MNEEQKKQVAIFRFGVISDFISLTRLGWGERARLLKQKCERSWQIPFSQRTRLAPATIRSWIRAYERSGQQLARLRRCAAEQQELTWCGVRFSVKGARRSGSRKPSLHGCLVPVH